MKFPKIEARLAAAQKVRESVSNSKFSNCDSAMVFVTGSVASGEYSPPHSDLDVFIVSLQPEGEDPKVIDYAWAVTQVDTLRDSYDFPSFTDHGKFLKAVSLASMTARIGDWNDHYDNLFTARMALLLNSIPCGSSARYNHAWQEVFDMYWRGQTDVGQPFTPVYLLNDIRRWWGEFCINFEANCPLQPKEHEHLSPEANEIRRRKGSVKLRYSRLLMVYSVIVGLLHVATDKGIERNAARKVLKETPIQRIMAMVESDQATICKRAESVLSRYESYIELTELPPSELSRLLSSSKKDKVREESIEFGSLLFDLMEHLGQRCPTLYRYAVM